jgi:hypothetical protein
MRALTFTTFFIRNIMVKILSKYHSQHLCESLVLRLLAMDRMSHNFYLLYHILSLLSQTISFSIFLSFGLCFYVDKCLSEPVRCRLQILMHLSSLQTSQLLGFNYLHVVGFLNLMYFAKLVFSFQVPTTFYLS